MADERRYSEREVRAILDRALDHESDGLTHGDLLAAAREAGISSEAVEKAALELDGLRAQDEARERLLTRRRAAFFSHLWAFITVQLFLLALNLLTSPDYLWFLFPLLGWGLGLSFAARHGLSKSVSDHALSREMARGPRAPHARRRVAPALAQPSAKLGSRAGKTALEHELDELDELEQSPSRGASDLVGETRSPRRVSPNVEEGPSAECPIGPGSTCPSPAQRGRGESGTNLGHEVPAAPDAARQRK